MTLRLCTLFVAVYSIQIVNSGVTKKDDFVPLTYPGPTNEVLTNRYGGTTADDVPKECQNQNYCAIKPKDYPQERFNKMFKGKVQLPQPTLVIEPSGSAVDRFGDPDEIDNCESTVSYEPLYKVRSKRGWHVVVQAPQENYVQMVRLETCQDNGGSCFTGLATLPNIKTTCKQKYSVWEFLVASDNGTERVQAELPICCSCHYKIVPLA